MPEIGRHHLSLVIPCYNEEEVIGYTVKKLLESFCDAGISLQIIAVDNGSSDRTGEIIQKIAASNFAVVPVRVEHNEGYGNGVLAGFRHCQADWVGSIPADGQVDAEDVVRLFEAARVTNGKVVAKVRRRFRMDGLTRKVVSVSYNLFFRALWPSLRTLDVNGSPKILRKEYLQAMNLYSKNWFLDPEIMVKAHYLGLRVLELNVFARMRGTGLSNVKPSACWEFFRDLLIFRFGGRRRILNKMTPITDWKGAETL